MGTPFELKEPLPHEPAVVVGVVVGVVVIVGVLSSFFLQDNIKPKHSNMIKYLFIFQRTIIKTKQELVAS